MLRIDLARRCARTVSFSVGPVDVILIKSDYVVAVIKTFKCMFASVVL